MNRLQADSSGECNIGKLPTNNCKENALASAGTQSQGKPSTLSWKLKRKLAP